MDKIQSLMLDVKVCDIVIEYLSAQLARYRHKRKNKREELVLCRALAKSQKKR